MVGRVEIRPRRPGLLGSGLRAGYQPINVVQRQARVGYRLQAGLLAQAAAAPVQGHAVPASVHMGLTPPDDGDLAAVLPDSHPFAISHPTRVTRHLRSLMPSVLCAVAVGPAWTRSAPATRGSTGRHWSARRSTPPGPQRGPLPAGSPAGWTRS